MSKEKAQAFFRKKKEEVKKTVNTKGQEGKEPNTSKMPEGLRKHFESKRGNSSERKQSGRMSRQEARAQYKSKKSNG